jgi:hypothetical protein
MVPKSGNRFSLARTCGSDKTMLKQVIAASGASP